MTKQKETKEGISLETLLNVKKGLVTLFTKEKNYSGFVDNVMLDECVSLYVPGVIGKSNGEIVTIMKENINSITIK
jgi:hypothetical protein